MILYSTGTVFFSLLYRLLRIRLKRQNPFISYVREREKVRRKCTMQCTVHLISTLFNVGNVLLYVIYQLNFTVFMYVTRISRYITLYIQRSVLSAVSRNSGWSWNVLPADKGVRLHIHLLRRNSKLHVAVGKILTNQKRTVFCLIQASRCSSMTALINKQNHS